MSRMGYQLSRIFQESRDDPQLTYAKNVTNNLPKELEIDIEVVGMNLFVGKDVSSTDHIAFIQLLMDMYDRCMTQTRNDNDRIEYEHSLLEGEL